MGQQQDNPAPAHDTQQTGGFFQPRLGRLKTLCAVGWQALGDVMLLIGGDDTVEISFNSNATPVAGTAFSSADRQH